MFVLEFDAMEKPEVCAELVKTSGAEQHGDRGYIFNDDEMKLRALTTRPDRPSPKSAPFRRARAAEDPLAR